MTREELLRSKEYWLGEIQHKFWEICDGPDSKHIFINDTLGYINDLHKHLNMKKKAIRKLLNGSYNGKISQLVAISLHFGKVPIIKFVDIEEIIEKDKEL
jgi:hypothetical protein